MQLRPREDTNRQMLRACDTMDRCYAEPLDVGTLAAIAHLSASQFGRVFKDVYGETPQRYLQRRRVERAMTLLRQTDRPVTDIAWDVGFASLGWTGTRRRSTSTSTHLGFEVRDDIDLGFMRWFTVALPGGEQLLHELVGGPPHDEATAVAVRELVTKGALGGLFLVSDDVRPTYAALRDAGVDITQEPSEQPHGIDFGIRDPFGNRIRISQPNDAPNEVIQEQYDAQA